MRFRNHLYNIGYTPAFEFEVNTIAVGNLSVGGTGKSPMVNYLAEHLKTDHQVATLSRGYGRKSRGFRVATMEDGPREIGDEPMMFFRRLGKEAVVAVSEDRAYAIPAMLFEAPDLGVIVLDDAYQHRSVKPGLNVLLTSHEKPFFKDYVLPSGRLRERRAGASRADIVVVTKCPNDLSDVAQTEMVRQIQQHSDASVFFTSVAYQDKVPFGTVMSRELESYVLVAGLANNDEFFTYAESNHQVLATYGFDDHHDYTAQEVSKIAAQLSDKVGLLTTEKDAMKLEKFPELQDYACFYVPISITFLQDEALFLKEVRNSLKEYEREAPEHSQDH